MQWYWIPLELTATVIDTIFFIFLPLCHLKLRNWVKKSYLIYFSILASLIIIADNYVTNNSPSSIVVSLLILLIYYICFLDGKVLHKLFWFFFLFALSYLTQQVVMVSISYFYNVSIEQFSLPNIYRLKLILYGKAILILILVLLLRVQIKRILSIEIKLNKLIIIPIIIMSFVTFIILAYIHIYNYINKSDIGINYLIITLGFVLINLLYLLLFIYFDNKNKKLLEQSLKAQQIELQKQNYEEISTHYEQLRQMEIDINNHLQVLWGLAKIHKVPKLEQYLSHFNQINQTFSRLYDTGNEIIDVVLSSKAAFAHQERIKLQADINFPKNYSFESLDIASILINLLNNAIEIQQKIEDEELEKLINLLMDTQDNMFVIKVEYPTDGKNINNSQILKKKVMSTVELGLKIIHELVNKYRGNIQIQHEDYYYTVLIKLPL